jgi:O-antigen ligase
MCQVVSGRSALACIALSGVVLVGTHTRTALVAMAVGMLVAGASLFLGHARVRRTSLWAMLMVLVTIGVFANELQTWALRGQTAQEAGDLTGRTKVWSAVFGAPRPLINDLFGSGMSNLSFDGLPIDSNWVGTYFDQGWVGVALDAGIVLVLLVAAATRERSPQRALAIFLIMYCLFASITETGMSNPSPYLLDLAVAASLILPGRQGATR